MGKIYLVRHGQSEDNANDIFGGHHDSILTQKGRDQAQEVAEKLKNYALDVIYSSPLKRASETAEIIAKQLGKEFSVEPGLIERNFGVLTGKPEADLDKYDTPLLESDGVKYFLEIPEAEDFPNLYYRAKQTLQAIKARHPSENVLLVTHGDFGKMLRAAHEGWGWQEGLQTPYFANAEVIELS